jgi:riboflavin synthase
MFTGLVEEKGALVRRAAGAAGAAGGSRLAIRCRMRPLVLGESISVDGVCLTVAAVEPEGFSCDASTETLARTTLGRMPVGGAVNLERAMTLGGRMGGHIVTGHVDGVGRVAARTRAGEAVEMRFSFPAELARYIAEKGSVCVSGVSLTVNRVEGDTFAVMLIPHTLEQTSLDELAVGAEVNLEVDILARYVARVLEHGGASTSGARASSDASLLEKLRSGGFV